MNRVLVGMLLLVLAAASLAACSATATVSGPADECAVARPLTSGTTTHTIRSGGRDRTYQLRVPPGYVATRRTPVVMMFHGLGGDPSTVIKATGMAKSADRRGAILVVPRGRGNPSHWEFTRPIDDPTSDLAFVRDLAKEVKRMGCVDSSRMYAVGFSNGSVLTLALACDASTEFAAYAAVAGPLYESRCDTAPPTSIIYFHGMADKVVPYRGAETVIGRLPPVNTIMAKWADHDACPVSGAATTVSKDVRHYAWSGCRGGSAVDIYAVVDGAHGWPGGGPMSPGRTSKTRDSPVHASTLIWEFFDRHRGGGD